MAKLTIDHASIDIAEALLCGRGTGLPWDASVTVYEDSEMTLRSAMNWKSLWLWVINGQPCLMAEAAIQASCTEMGLPCRRRSTQILAHCLQISLSYGTTT